MKQFFLTQLKHTKTQAGVELDVGYAKLDLYSVLDQQRYLRAEGLRRHYSAIVLQTTSNTFET